MEQYCWDKDRASEAFGARFIGCQIPYQLQNLRILSTFERHKSPHGQNFWNLDLFIRNDKVTQILTEQKSTCDHIISIHKSYKDTIEAISGKKKKNRAKVKFYFFWEAVSQFCYRQALHIFSLHIAPRNLICFKKSTTVA